MRTVQSDQGLHCLLTETFDATEHMKGDQRHVQNDLNLHLLCIFEGTFSLDSPQIFIYWDI